MRLPNEVAFQTEIRASAERSMIGGRVSEEDSEERDSEGRRRRRRERRRRGQVRGTRERTSIHVH